MLATGIPTARLRVVTRAGKPIIQQHHLVTFEPGTTKESTRWIWLDIPHGTETRQEEEARVAVERLGSEFATPKEQLVR